MLEFFRKYQRYFFFFITAVIITSFCFFGTFSTFSREETREDRLLTHAVDGSPIMLSEVQALSRFISADREDASQSGVLPNLCNDGVVRYDLLRTGLADLLARRYFETIQEECESRLDRAKRFRPYAHPHTPLVSVEAVWQQFLPAMKGELSSLQEEKEASPATFSHLSHLYQQQHFLPPESLRRVLFFQHQRLGLNIDPNLQHADLSLFGFHSLTDWFGRDFLTIASEFILNAAALAEKKGYSVTLEEAKGDLISHFQSSLEKLSKDSSNPAISYSQHLRQLGFDEKSASEVWRKVLLFRRYFQGISQAAFVDRLPFKDFASYARETATVAQYVWPEPLRLKKIEDLVEFQYYLTATAPPLADPLSLPTSFHSLDVVEEDYPELVQAAFKAKVKTVPLSQIALRAPIKEVWEWQLDEKNWEAMQSHFSFLSQGCAREERFQCLEKLQAPQRQEVDSFARLSLLEKHPEWREAALAALPTLEKTISISKASASLPRVEKPWRLSALLQKAASGLEEAKEDLLAYSDDGKTLFRIEEIENVSPPRILTFAEARSQGVLAKIRDRSLSAAYLKLRSKHPQKFQSKEGSWKPFSEVKDEVAKLVFPEVFQAIEALEERNWTNDSYAEYRLLPATRAAFNDLKRNPEDPNWLDGPFKLERRELPIQRTAEEEWMKEKAFEMMPGDWSPIRVYPDGELSFFYLIDKKPCENPVLDQIAFGKELIAADAQRYLAEKLLESIFKNHSIVLPKEDAQ